MAPGGEGRTLGKADCGGCGGQGGPASVCLVSQIPVLPKARHLTHTPPPHIEPDSQARHKSQLSQAPEPVN